MKRQRRVEDNLKDQHGCLRIKTVLDGRLPFGIDLVKGLVGANADNRITLFMRPFIEALGPTLELRMIGNAGIVTTDPDNIKAILSKKSDDGELGKCISLRWLCLSKTDEL